MRRLRTSFTALLARSAATLAAATLAAGTLAAATLAAGTLAACGGDEADDLSDDGVATGVAEEGTYEPPGVLMDATTVQGAPEVVATLQAALDDSPEVQLLGAVDHAAAARGAGLELRPATVLLFDNPVYAAEVVMRSQEAAIDLPRRVLVYEAPDGRVHVASHATAWLRDRHDLGRVEALSKYDNVLVDLFQRASGERPDRPQVFAVPEGQGLERIPSRFDVETTWSRLEQAVQASTGLDVVETMDYEAYVANAGVDLRPTRLMLLGNPALGTRLMQGAPTAAADLPLRVLVWEDSDGVTWLTYEEPDYLADRHGFEGAEEVVDQMTETMRGLVATAAGG